MIFITYKKQTLKFSFVFKIQKVKNKDVHFKEN